jgi:replicative DNA helicase
MSEFTATDRRNETEDMLLGKLITYSECFHECDLDEEDFCRTESRQVFNAMQSLSSQGKKWDMLILWHELERRYGAYLSEIMADDIGVEQTIPSYVNILKRYRAAELVSNVALDVDPSDPLAFAVELQERASKINRESDVKHISSVMKEVCGRLEKASENRGIQGPPSGFSMLDNYLWGFQQSRLYILAGRPSMGKSSFATNVAVNAAKEGHTVYVQSLEESGTSIAQRILSRYSRVSNEDLQRGNIDGDQWNGIAGETVKISELPLWVSEKGALSSAQISNEVRKLNSRNKLDLVIIDHLQQIREDEKSRHLEVSRSCQTFKSLAKELKLPIILLCQLSREVERRTVKDPTLSDLKESGDIEAVADVVMGLYRPAYYDKDRFDDTVNVGILKNRDGRTGQMELKWAPRYMTFSDQETLGN